MPIGIQYGDPAAVGYASLLIGQGQNAQRQEDLARRDAEFALRQAAFAEQQEQADISNQMAAQQQAFSQYDRDRSFRYGAYQDAAGRAMQQQQLAQQASQFGQNMQADAARAQMQQLSQREQQQMMLAREQARDIALADRDRRMNTAKMAATDWAALQKARVDGRTFISDEHYQAAVDKWKASYATLGEPLPLDLPMPESSVPPKLQAYFETHEIPYDEQTGEPLIPWNVIVAGIQAKNQQYQAEVKSDTATHAAQAKAEVEQAKVSAAAQQAAQKEAARVIAAAFESKAKRDAQVWGQDTYAEEVQGPNGKTQKVERTTQGYAPQMAYDQAMATNPPPLVTDPNVWALLPPGTIYRAPDGQIYTKG